jgi:hypothetical protein
LEKLFRSIDVEAGRGEKTWEELRNIALSEDPDSTVAAWLERAAYTISGTKGIIRLRFGT